MRLFTKDGHINFVDENNVFLGYDLNQDCCENADWFIAAEPQLKPIKRDNDNPSLDGWLFDRDWRMEIKGGPLDEGRMLAFRIRKGPSEQFIHIFNEHNGYYAHGFTFQKRPDGEAEKGDL